MDLAVLETQESPELATSLDIEETTQQFFECMGEETAVDSLTYRDRLLEEYPDLMPVTERIWNFHDVLYGSSYLERSRQCRTRSWYVRDDADMSVAVHSNACRLRWCPMCAEMRKKTVARSCFDFLKDQGRVRLLTLTVKHGDKPLTDQLEFLKKCFIKLRNSVKWKRYVTGCVWFLHVKDNGANRGWHPHLHVLLTGQYVPQEWLSAKWRKITGESFIVDIREVYDLEEALFDACRYVGRPANLLDVEEDCRVDLMHALDGVRLCGTTGICKAISLRPPRLKDREGNYTVLGSYYAVHRLASLGDIQARQILQAERLGQPIPPGIFCPHVDEFDSDEHVRGLVNERNRPPPEVDTFSYRQEELLWTDVY